MKNRVLAAGLLFFSLIMLSLVYLPNRSGSQMGDSGLSCYYPYPPITAEPKLLKILNENSINYGNITVDNDKLYINSQDIFLYDLNSLQQLNYLARFGEPGFYEGFYIYGENIYAVNFNSILEIYNKASFNSVTKYYFNEDFVFNNLTDRYFAYATVEYVSTNESQILMVYPITNNSKLNYHNVYIINSDYSVSSQPAIHGDYLVCQSRIGIAAYNMAKKEKIWQWNEGIAVDNDGICKTYTINPVIYREKVFALTLDNDNDFYISCFGLYSGKLLWKNRVGKKSEGFPYTHLYAFNDNIYCNARGFSIKTGKMILDDPEGLVAGGNPIAENKLVSCYQGIVYYSTANGWIGAYSLYQKKILWTFHIDGELHVMGTPRIGMDKIIVSNGENAVYILGND